MTSHLDLNQTGNNIYWSTYRSVLNTMPDKPNWEFNWFLGKRLSEESSSFVKVYVEIQSVKISKDEDNDDIVEISYSYIVNKMLSIQGKVTFGGHNFHKDLKRYFSELENGTQSLIAYYDPKEPFNHLLEYCVEGRMLWDPFLFLETKEFEFFKEYYKKYMTSFKDFEEPKYILLDSDFTIGIFSKKDDSSSLIMVLKGSIDTFGISRLLEVIDDCKKHEIISLQINFHNIEYLTPQFVARYIERTRSYKNEMKIALINFPEEIKKAFYSIGLDLLINLDQIM